MSRERYGALLSKLPPVGVLVQFLSHSVTKNSPWSGAKQKTEMQSIHSFASHLLKGHRHIKPFPCASVSPDVKFKILILLVKCSEFCWQILVCNSSQVLYWASTSLQLWQKDCTCYSASTMDGPKPSEVLLGRARTIQ